MRGGGERCAYYYYYLFLLDCTLANDKVMNNAHDEARLLNVHRIRTIRFPFCTNGSARRATL